MRSVMLRIVWPMKTIEIWRFGAPWAGCGTAWSCPYLISDWDIQRFFTSKDLKMLLTQNTGLNFYSSQFFNSKTSWLCDFSPRQPSWCLLSGFLAAGLAAPQVDASRRATTTTSIRKSWYLKHFKTMRKKQCLSFKFFFIFQYCPYLSLLCIYDFFWPCTAAPRLAGYCRFSQGSSLVMCAAYWLVKSWNFSNDWIWDSTKLKSYFWESVSPADSACFEPGVHLGLKFLPEASASDLVLFSDLYNASLTIYFLDTLASMSRHKSFGTSRTQAKKATDNIYS